MMVWSPLLLRSVALGTADTHAALIYRLSLVPDHVRREDLGCSDSWSGQMERSALDSIQWTQPRSDYG